MFIVPKIHDALFDPKQTKFYVPVSTFNLASMHINRRKAAGSNYLSSRELKHFRGKARREKVLRWRDNWLCRYITWLDIIHGEFVG